MSYNDIEVAHIVAVSHNNNCIGKNNEIPWHLSEDLKRFRKLTAPSEDREYNQGIVIMGRRTFESIGSKPLSRRLNIVVSSTGTDSTRDYVAVTSVEDALEYASNYAKNVKHINTIWIIGGARLYAETLKYTDRIELTSVEKEVSEGDVFYPKVPDDFMPTKLGPRLIDPESSLKYTHITFNRRDSNGAIRFPTTKGFIMNKPIISHPKADKKSQLTLTLKPLPKNNKQSILKLDTHMGNRLSFEHMAQLNQMGVKEPFLINKVSSLNEIEIDSDVGEITIYSIDAKTGEAVVDNLFYSDTDHLNETQYISVADMRTELSTSTDSPLIIVTRPQHDSTDNPSDRVQTYMLHHCPNGYATYRGDL